METRPDQPPEGKLISDATHRLKISIREAARRAGISYGRWRQITTGYQNVSPGVYAPVHAPPRTVAKMAVVVGITPDQMETQGQRPDVAEILRSETLALVLRVAAEPDLLPTTDAMELAIRVHMQEVNDRLEFVRRRFPGQRLTGLMMFPTAPRDQRVWDGLVADGETEEATAQGIAAMRAWRQEKAAAQENGTVTAIRRA